MAPRISNGDYSAASRVRISEVHIGAIRAKILPLFFFFFYEGLACIACSREPCRGTPVRILTLQITQGLQMHRRVVLHMRQTFSVPLIQAFGHALSRHTLDCLFLRRCASLPASTTLPECLPALSEILAQCAILPVPWS